jgi:hypothetical protein
MIITNDHDDKCDIYMYKKKYKPRNDDVFRWIRKYSTDI